MNFVGGQKLCFKLKRGCGPPQVQLSHIWIVPVTNAQNTNSECPSVVDLAGWLKLLLRLFFARGHQQSAPNFSELVFSRLSAPPHCIPKQPPLGRSRASAVAPGKQMEAGDFMVHLAEQRRVLVPTRIQHLVGCATDSRHRPERSVADKAPQVLPR